MSTKSINYKKKKYLNPALLGRKGIFSWLTPLEIKTITSYIEEFFIF